MTAEALGATTPVSVGELRIGDLLAEGGEGRVYELPLQPHLVYKAYRRPVPEEQLDQLVAWPLGLPPDLQPRVDAAAAWPARVVLSEGGSAAGLLLPRAPRRFALRHKDGTTRLASLSYLTADPAHRAVAYGLQLPPEAGPERIGVVYALARLLEVFESTAPAVGHGDLSAKNVLWSLQRGPEVFVIDCDNSERFGTEGETWSRPGRRRAMTPNWEDPAVRPGHNPGPESDRYSLALIFLRVVGAANFPIQARQREQTRISVDFALPRPMLDPRLLGPGAEVWELCRGGLNVARPQDRPPAQAWVATLESLLEGMGAGQVARAVWTTQGGGPAVSTSFTAVPGPAGPLEVEIRPLARATPRPVPQVTRVPNRRDFGGGFRSAPLHPSTASLGSVRAPARDPSAPVFRPLGARLVHGVGWWMGAHRRAAQAMMTGGHRVEGARSLGVCVVLDLVGLVVVLFLAAMVVAPITGL